VRAFGDRLAERSGIPVYFVDERYTSVSAERAVRALGLPRRERERKDRVDAAAAVLILQSFLDRRRADDAPPGG
jgi:putative holliday junction resolvase